MKRHLLKYLSLLGLALALALPMAASAVTIRGDAGVMPDLRPQCYANATATNVATTVDTDITGLTCAFVPRRNDPTTAARAVADLVKVSYSLDALKSTGTSANCGVYVNGSRDSTTTRYIYYTTTNISGHTLNIGGTFIVPLTTVGAQTIKLQCASADTSTLAVTRGHFYVEEIVRY